MSDCPVCGPAGEEGPCLAHSAPLLTPPTPDPRERGVNYAAMMAARDENERDAARVADAYLADHGVRWSPGAAQMAADLLALEALRAPAPREAVSATDSDAFGQGIMGPPRIGPGMVLEGRATNDNPMGRAVSDERKCVCGHAGFEHAGKTRLGNECLGDNLRCSCKYFTPPTPDPRERGEMASATGEALLDRLDVTAHRVSRAIGWTEGSVRAGLAALRAPAPSEALAWMVEFKRPDESDWQKSGPHFSYAEAEQDQTRLLLRHWPAHIVPLYTRPAPARGVTVTEAMVERAMGVECGSTHHEHHPPDCRRCWQAKLTAALTPDAEGGA